MGNCCGGSASCPVVHPSEPHQPKHARLQIKVRMTARELKELLEEAGEVGKGPGRDIGQLIVRECLRGKYHARFVGPLFESEEATTTSLGGPGKVRNLETITEEGD